MKILLHPVMHRCEPCSIDVPAPAEYCPKCLGALTGVATHAATRGSDAPAAAVQTPHSDDAHCGRHPGRPLIGTCARCGTFVCIICAPEFASNEQRPCSACLNLADVRDAASNARKTIRAAGGSGILYGLLMGALFSIGTDSALLGVIAATPYIITGVLLALTCWRWLGYVLFVLQALALIVVGGIRLKIGLAVWAFATLGLVSQARELRSEGADPQG